MFIEIIEKVTTSIYWDFFSTLVAIFVGIIFTWWLSYLYYRKANTYAQRLNTILFKELSELNPNKSFKIEHDEKGLPKQVVFVNATEELGVALNVETKVKRYKSNKGTEIPQDK